MAAAYRYADGEGKIPHELEWLRYGERFGWLAVFGRQPTPREMRLMTTADNVMRAYQSRSTAENWAAWANDNPEMNRLLNSALLAAEHGE